jgi:hypothetical protein
MQVLRHQIANVCRLLLIASFFDFTLTVVKPNFSNDDSSAQINSLEAFLWMINSTTTDTVAFTAFSLVP